MTNHQIPLVLGHWSFVGHRGLVICISMAAISLVISVFNRARFVGDAIRSVLHQTRRDFELVVIDDGSTDDSLNIARDAVKGDPRVRVIASQNQGHPASLNAAAKMMSAPYFGWIDSDD